MTVDERLKAGLTAARAARHGAGGVVGGSGGPHDPDMEARLTTLEADGRTTKAGIARIETAIVRIEETLKYLATKADLAEVKGAVNTLEAKVTAFDARVGRVEAIMSTALTTAVGKAIGPWQLPVIVGASAAALAAIATGYAWLSHQTWFPH